MTKVISEEAIENRKFWVEKILNLKGTFSNEVGNIEKELKSEIEEKGIATLINHLRLCSSIPESYEHDSTEEKLYSKYTDCVLSLAFENLGLKSLVLSERADSADVEAFAKNFSFVADAKAFRLSRTAKNQKDFKVQAMNGWKRGKPYAMVVCPIYQLPSSSSQIYEQATTQNVCIFTYSHLALLVSFATLEGKDKSEELLKSIFETVKAFNPSKNATDYWITMNKTILSYSDKIGTLWEEEKRVSVESIAIAKEEALTFLAKERERIMTMSHAEALNELIKIHKIENRVKTIISVSDNKLFTLK